MKGKGPEHSSARIERYLQLAAEDNIQVCQPSNAAQYFQLLRRQALRRWRKPMIVFTPKSMLRHPDASSPIEDFQRPRFEWVVPDREVTSAERILICSGKIGHELRAERKRRGDTNTAILFLDQLYPFPKNELRAEMARHPNAREIVWVQEEPANMGALSYVLPRIRHVFSGHSGAFGEALGQREPGDGLGQGARARTENIADAGVHHGPELTGTCLRNPSRVRRLDAPGAKAQSSLASLMSRLKPRPTKLV